MDDLGTEDRKINSLELGSSHNHESNSEEFENRSELQKNSSCKQFQTEPKLRNHGVKDHSSSPKVFKCDQCEKEFKWKRSLKRHYFVHTKLYLHRCSICNKGFPSQTSMKKHEHATHFDEQRGNCSRIHDECELQDHVVKEHPSSPKVFKCDQCEKV